MVNPIRDLLLVLITFYYLVLIIPLKPITYENSNKWLLHI